MLRGLQTDADRDKALGIGPKERERQRPVSVLIAEYGSHLRSKENTAVYVTMTLTRVRSVLSAAKIGTVSGLDAGKIARVLATWREKGPPQTPKGRKPKPLGVGTSNHYARAAKGFSRWLWTEGKTPDDQLRSLRLLNAKADRRRVRRALTGHEVRRLVDATKASGKAYKGSTRRLRPAARAWLYTLAVFAGLRASELASLMVASFDLDAKTVTVRAAYSKRRREDVLPLHASLVEDLRTWIGSKTGTLWPGRWTLFGGRIVQRDLKRAGIAYQGAAGRDADLHALRHTFVSSLARSGVHPSVAKELARHSTITLTMDAYTHAGTETLRKSLDTLTPLG